MNQDWVNNLWAMNGWRNSQGKPVSNKSLWELIDEVAKSHTYIEFRKVKGHVGIELNERADKLCVKGRHDIEVKLGLRDSKEKDFCTCKDCKKVTVDSDGIFGKFLI